MGPNSLNRKQPHPIALAEPQNRPAARQKSVLRFLGVAIPVLGLCVGAAGVVTTVIMQRQQMVLQAALKRSETINSRREAYVGFIEALEASYREARSGEWSVLMRTLQDMEKAFLQVEAFVSEPQRQAAWKEVYDLEVFCKDVWKLQRVKTAKRRNTTAEFVDRRERIKAQLRSALFR